MFELIVTYLTVVVLIVIPLMVTVHKWYQFLIIKLLPMFLGIIHMMFLLKQLEVI